MLIKIACKLTQEQNNSETRRQKDSVINVDQLQLSLDVPAKNSLHRRTKTMEISLEEIRKVLQNANDEEKDGNIKVM